MEKEETKRCGNPNCQNTGKELPFSEFHRHSGRSDGLQPFCKECNKKNNNNANRKSKFREKYALEGDEGVYDLCRKSDDFVVYTGESEELGGRFEDHFRKSKGNKRSALWMYTPEEREELFYHRVHKYTDNKVERVMIEKQRIRLLKELGNDTLNIKA